jgi:hypothetical protein
MWFSAGELGSPVHQGTNANGSITPVDAVRISPVDAHRHWRLTARSVPSVITAVALAPAMRGRMKSETTDERMIGSRPGVPEMDSARHVVFATLVSADAARSWIVMQPLHPGTVYTPSCASTVAAAPSSNSAAKMKRRRI